MYSPRVSDAEVRVLIRELTVKRTLPSGAAVRTALSARFGSRGGVARIYRLLAEERIRLTPLPPVGSVEAMRREVELLREKLAQSQEREYAHQSHWAEEVDRLRLKVATLEPLVQQARISGSSDQLLRHRLQAAERRAAALEQQLYELARRRGEGTDVLPDVTPVEGTIAVPSAIPA
jgi:hypothetical protein